MFYLYTTKIISMKRKILLVAAGSFLLFGMATAQIFLPEPFAAWSPKAPLLVESFSSPSAWRQDSTWESHWNSTGTDWQRYKRTMRTFNGSGRLASQVTLRWDFNLSEWVNYETTSNEYYPDNTTLKRTSRSQWDQSAYAWVELYHCYYNDSGKPTESEEKTYDFTTSSYLSGSLTQFTYSPGNEVHLRKTLVPATMIWENNFRTTINFDGQGNEISYLSEGWIAGTSTWMNAGYVEMTYTAQGQMLEMIMQVWDPVTSFWKNSIRVTCEYNSSGWLVNYTGYSWDQVLVVWRNNIKILYHYDEDGNQIQAESYEWDNTLSAWLNNQKQVSTYYATGVMHETWRSVWVTGISQFIDIEYGGYNDAGDEVESWHKSIDYQTFEFYQGSRTLTTYTDGMLTEALHQSLETPGMTWIPSWRKTNTWDANRNLTVELHENYNDATQAWTNSTKYDHFYTTYIGIDEIAQLTSLCFFENPLSPGGTIQCPGLSPDESYTIRLISLTGQTIFTQTLPGTGSLSLPETVATGQYILLIAGSNGTTASGKVVVLKR